MRANKEKILEFAKELYLTPNELGNHKYSLRNICDKIRQKFDKRLTAQTILNWARKYGWVELWEQAVREGITKDFKSDKEKTKEEQFRELIAKRKHDDFVMASNLKVLGYKFIKEHGFSSVSEALKAIDTGMKYTQDIEELDIRKTENLAEFLLRGLKRGR